MPLTKTGKLSGAAAAEDSGVCVVRLKLIHHAAEAGGTELKI
jgi:hypothetical protein